MKKPLLLFAANFLLFFAQAQTGWQQHVDYTIDVALNDKEKTLDGFETIVYTNRSPDTLTFIWFHLWPNAYKNDRTAFSDQLLENGDTRFYFSDKEERGYINRLDFRVNGAGAKTVDHPQYIDVVKLLLPTPLPPGGQTTVTTPFHIKLPFNFSRGGYDGQSFQVTQWYPKPAVYDAAGWHEMPYLDQGEFYSEFGSFDVRITVPKTYVVAATGELQNEDEKQWLKTRATYAAPAAPPKAKSMARPATRTATRRQVPAAVQPSSAVALPGSKTLQYKQENVHDFAWFADKNFIVNSDTLRLPSGAVVTVSSFYTPGEKAAWRNSVGYAKDALRFYSHQIGEYPYRVASVVQGPQSFGGGMEYPTITVLSPESDPQTLDATIAHELGHNWFYGILASNERTYPWMDEGFNTFYENKYVRAKYGTQPQWEELLFQRKATLKTDQPINTPSHLLSATNYGLVTYHKTAEWMREVEQAVGDTAFRQMMHRYFQEWKFRHPQPADFRRIAGESLGEYASPVLARLETNGILPSHRLTGTKIIFPLQKKSVAAALASPAKNMLLVSPAAGANSYDGIMAGGIVTNYASPTTAFHFLAIPLYATRSGSFAGLGRVAYTFTSRRAIRKTDLFLNASSFHMDEFSDTADHRYQIRFVKLVPGIRLTFRQKNPRSTVTRYAEWKTYLLNEQSLDVSTDSVFGATDTMVYRRYATPYSHRYVNRLQFVYRDDRALYPFRAQLRVDQGSDFLRTSFTGDYFFNYAKGGGLAVRLFGGKFNYLGGKTQQKQFASDRYFLNLTGPKGYEDYTYSDYFAGRNKFEGLASQQIMIRDGAFKVRTDLLASKVGKTDNWLAALNFVTTIPPSINPFSVLPVKIPLRFFVDAGSYAEAWNRTGDGDRFLFDAGLEVPLFHDMLTVYVPLFYSKVYSTYFKSTIPDNRFLKTISFSLHFYNKDVKKLNREWEF